MPILDDLATADQRRLLSSLTSPAAIQAFLDEVPYSAEPVYRCPLRVMQDRLAHCFDGALFAAAALERLGEPPLILELLPNERDDDHLLAVYRRHGCWGAVAKSNFVGLRYREPIHRTLRELVLSYFEQYYNVAGEKTLRGYTVPLDLSVYGERRWQVSDEPLQDIADHTDRLRRYWLLSSALLAELSPVDPRSLAAGQLGADPAGLYQPAMPDRGAP